MTINAVCETASQASALKDMPGIGRIFSPEDTLPHVFREADRDRVKDMLQRPVLLARSIDGLGYLKKEGYRGEIVADHSLYSFNKNSVRTLRSLGVSGFTAPLELSYHELQKRGMEDTELVIYGRAPMMISASCLYRNTHDDICPVRAGSGDGASDAADGRADNGAKSGVQRAAKDGVRDGMRKVVLRDRMHTDFPAVCHCTFCYNVIYNSVPLSLHKEMDRVMSLEPAALRLDFTVEDEEETYNIARYFINLAAGKGSGDPPFSGFTKGHFIKGVQ